MTKYNRDSELGRLKRQYCTNKQGLIGQQDVSTLTNSNNDQNALQPSIIDSQDTLQPSVLDTSSLNSMQNDLQSESLAATASFDIEPTVAQSNAPRTESVAINDKRATRSTTDSTAPKTKSAAINDKQATRSTTDSTCQPEAGHAPSKPYQKLCLAFLGRIIDVPLTALENLIASNYYVPFLMLVMLVVTILPAWYYLWRMDSLAGWFLHTTGHWWRSIAGASHFVLKQITDLGCTLYRNLSDVLLSKPMVISGAGSTPEHRAALPSIFTSILCTLTTPLAWWSVPWLPTQCRPATESEQAPILTTLNDTNNELHQWADISVSFGPYINTFQLATIPLARQRQVLRYYSDVTFRGKELLLDNLPKYSESLYESGCCLRDVSLTTDQLIKVMVYNLHEIDQAIRASIEVDFGWWKPSNHKMSNIIFIIKDVLEVLEGQFYDLIDSIEVCRKHLVNATIHGAAVEGNFMKAQKDVQVQMHKQQGLFRKPDEALSEVDQILSSAITFPTKEIVNMLRHGVVRLKNHHAQLVNAKTKMEMAKKLSRLNGLNQLLNLLQAILEGLSNERGRLAAARAKQKREFEEQTKQGLILHPQS